MHTRKIPLDTSGELREDTTELSFILCPSPHDGVGVFCIHGIKKGAPLRLFSGPDPRLIPYENMKDNPLLEAFCHRYGIEGNAGCYVSRDFRYMEIGWYLNHSAAPNAWRKGECHFFASRDIAAGEEITIDYQTL